MSDPSIFRSKQTMPVSGEGVVRTDMTLAESSVWGGLPLIGMRRNLNDVVNTHAGKPNPTGRRP